MPSKGITILGRSGELLDVPGGERFVIGFDPPLQFGELLESSSGPSIKHTDDPERKSIIALEFAEDTVGDGYNTKGIVAFLERAERITRKLGRTCYNPDNIAQIDDPRAIVSQVLDGCYVIGSATMADQ